ncbi:hypothetical protein [Salinibacterium sp. PAMC 21357]|uniref:hypothetical protein n=1 Tax=Salinibacterium sp. PAMC 21357 TaxID=1112215 RepID=UPI0002888752|nr:hypothetical protein [Salinibacterium sp. PAMC 21357]
MSIEVEIDIEDLGSDSSKWYESSLKLAALAQASASRDLPDSAFMMAGYPLAQIYRGYLNTVSALLLDGATQSDDVSKLLRSAARSYIEADESVVDEVRALLAEIDGN